MLNRRDFGRISVATAGVLLPASLSGNHADDSRGPADSEPAEAFPPTCDLAVKRLLAGNSRFVLGKTRHPHAGQDWRRRLTDGQKPFATILGCSDSRVPPEMLFDQGFGDLFVVRVAGNVVDLDVTGSIEYGVEHLKTKVVIVMGHESCGAVTAALQSLSQLKHEPKEIRSLVRKIRPALNTSKPSVNASKQIQAGVEANVRQSVKQLQDIKALARAEKAQRTRIIGCVYELKTGRVKTLT